MIRVCGAHGCSGAQGTLHAQGTGDGAGGDEVVRRVGPTVNAARGARAVGEHNLGTLSRGQLGLCQQDARSPHPGG